MKVITVLNLLLQLILLINFIKYDYLAPRGTLKTFPHFMVYVSCRNVGVWGTKYWICAFGEVASLLLTGGVYLVVGL